MNERILTPIQDAHTNPVIEIREGQLLFRSRTQGGTTMERFISFEAMREAVSNIPVDSGWLGAEIVRWGNGRIGEWVVAFIAPAHWDLELTEGVPGPDEKIVRVRAPLPGIVMFGGGVRYWVWAQKTERCEPHQEIYRCPLPNVMQDGSICWGQVKPPQASPRSILRAWELFIKSTFNNHAAPGKSKKHPDDVRELLKEAAGPGPGEMVKVTAFAPDEMPVAVTWMPRYPVEDLERQVEHTGITLDRAVRGFFEKGEFPG